MQKINPFIFLFYEGSSCIFPNLKGRTRLTKIDSESIQCHRRDGNPGDKQLKQNRAVSYGQIFATEEPGQSFLCIKEQVRGRAQEIHPKTGSKISTQEFLGSGKRKFKMGAGHRQRDEPVLPICPQQTSMYFSM